MLSFEFEKELLVAIENATAGIMIKPSWVLSFIEPVIERNCQSAQQKMHPTLGESSASDSESTPAPRR